MKTVFTTLAVAAVSATALFAPANAMVQPTQLELSIGVDAADYGKFTLAELIVIKSDSESERSE